MNGLKCLTLFLICFGTISNNWAIETDEHVIGTLLLRYKKMIAENRWLVTIPLHDIRLISLIVWIHICLKTIGHTSIGWLNNKGLMINDCGCPLSPLNFTGSTYTCHFHGQVRSRHALRCPKAIHGSAALRSGRADSCGCPAQILVDFLECGDASMTHEIIWNPWGFRWWNCGLASWARGQWRCTSTKPSCNDIRGALLKCDGFRRCAEVRERTDFTLFHLLYFFLKQPPRDTEVLPVSICFSNVFHPRKTHQITNVRLQLSSVKMSPIPCCRRWSTWV